MYRNFYSKQGKITTYLARDILSLDIGEKIPTIAEYVEKFGISRGIVQQAIAFLLEQNAIELYKGGKNGTILTKSNPEILQKFTGWDSISGTMPVPFSTQFLSLATAIYSEMNNFPIPFSLAYIPGANVRYKQIQKEAFDFTVVSELSAREILEKNDDLEILLNLSNCTYSSQHYLFFTNEDKKEICDGLKVGIDNTCIDQSYITKQVFKNYKVKYVVLPYVTLTTMKDRTKIDCFISRYEKNIPLLNELYKIPVDSSHVNNCNPEIPVILINKRNYGLKKLFRKYFSIKSCGETQKNVNKGKLPIEFF